MPIVPNANSSGQGDASKLAPYVSHEQAAMALFDLGETLVSQAALATLGAHGLAADTFFARHASGDWGEAEEFDRKGNAFALQHGITRFPIQSVYPLPGGELLVVMTTPDRTRTGMLLEHELEEHEVSTREGYARWAHQYDREVNPLIAIETPHVEQMLAELQFELVLDAAVGTGRHALRLAEDGARVAAIDQSLEMLAEARAAAARRGLEIDFRQGSLDELLPYPDGQFDLIICALALCHVVNLRGAVREFARVLRPGGAVLITDFHPYCVGQGWRAALFDAGAAYVFTYPGHTRDDYLAALSDAGLRITRTVDATMGEAPPGVMLDEEREGGKDIPFCFIALALKPGKPESEAISTHNSKFIKAPPEAIYHALTDPSALVVWRVPGEMTGKVHEFDYRVGGGYQMSLYYPSSEETMRGKTSGREDRYSARFVELTPPSRIVEAITFDSPDSAFLGEMVMEVTLEAEAGGTIVSIVFKNLPSGIRPEDNEAGTQSALEKLARYVESAHKGQE